MGTVVQWVHWNNGRSDTVNSVQHNKPVRELTILSNDDIF